MERDHMKNTLVNRRMILNKMNLCDDSILIYLLCLWTLSIILILFKKHNVSKTGFCLHLQVEPLNLAQSIELVRISGQQHKHKIGYINQAHHKPSARGKTNIKNI
jgi:hypothetical protein